MTMPILRKPDDQAPLHQGDILTSVALASTAADWTSSEQVTAPACMVVSRPCVIANKRHIVVAAVKGQTQNPPASALVDSGTYRAFLTDLRDGATRPDRFYLAQIPSLDLGRYYAHLDSLHTLALPPKQELQNLLSQHRVAQLVDDFLCDFHARLFMSVARQGFDDTAWFSDSDLLTMLPKVEADRAALDGELAVAESSGHKLKAKSKETTEKQRDELLKLENSLRSEIQRRKLGNDA